MMPVKVKNIERLPRSFDARQKWPGWVSGPTDQVRPLTRISYEQPHKLDTDCNNFFFASRDGVDHHGP